MDIKRKVIGTKCAIKCIMSRFTLPVLDEAVRHSDEVMKEYLTKVESDLRDRVYELRFNRPRPTDPVELAMRREERIYFRTGPPPV